jgi:hypothetical protein
VFTPPTVKPLSPEELRHLAREQLMLTSGPVTDELKYPKSLKQTPITLFKMPAASVASAPVNRTANRTTASRTKKPTQSVTKKTQPATNGATNGANPNMSPYTIMASRIANRVAEMAENITFVERERYVPLPIQLGCVSGRWAQRLQRPTASCVRPTK